MPMLQELGSTHGATALSQHALWLIAPLASRYTPLAGEAWCTPPVQLRV